MEISKKILENKDFDELLKITNQQNKEIKNLQKSLNAQVEITKSNVATIKKLKEKPEIKKERKLEQDEKNEKRILKQRELKGKEGSKFN